MDENRILQKRGLRRLRLADPEDVKTPERGAYY
jgi:hypothetical protein